MTLERVARVISPIPYGDDTSAIQAAIDAMQPEIDAAFQRGVVAMKGAAIDVAVSQELKVLGKSVVSFCERTACRNCGIAIYGIDPATIKDIDHANAARNY
jgi:hypothetical protein